MGVWEVPLYIVVNYTTSMGTRKPTGHLQVSLKILDQDRVNLPQA